MHQVLHLFLNKFVVVYFDDILIYSKNEQDQMQHLKLVFEALQKSKLFINLKKCIFCTEEISFLGFIISENQVKMDERKVEAVTKWSIPKTVKEIQAFIGLTSFYRKFIKNFSSITAPMTDCLKKGTFFWEEKQQHSFNSIKRKLASQPVLKLSEFDSPFEVAVDAMEWELVLSFLKEVIR
ncbi:hypothetical protein IC582_001294 [Cucumis melo]